MNKLQNYRKRILLSCATLALCGQSAFAQTNADENEEPRVEDEIVVVGSRIAGTQIGGALPVTVLSEQTIDTIAAVSGEELFLSIPQAGDVSFNQTRGQVSSNFARGDVGSVDLRNLGIGNTLALINGRRGVNFPSSQASNTLAPVLTFNTNTIPVNGVSRVEVLRDGAGAIYGSDAVAGVVNTVLKDDYDGIKVDLQYGKAFGTNLDEFTANGLIGKNFKNGRGNITLFMNYTDRSALEADDQVFTESADKRPLFAGTEFEDSLSLRNTSATTPFGIFETVGNVVVSDGMGAITSASGGFNVQPLSNPGCRANSTQPGLCFDDGTGTDANLRHDAFKQYNISVRPDLQRTNLFAQGNYELNESLEVFGEAGFYQGKTQSVQDAIFTIGSIRMTIPASNYWNPFGPVTFDDGSVNPNRLPGIDAPAEGLPIVLRTLRFSDLGPTNVDVTAEQYRLLGGLRGDVGGWDWESAILYSEANVDDRQEGIDATAFQRNLALSTPDAFNPFNGGNPNDPQGPDTTISSQASIDAISTINNRKNKTTLFQVDANASRPDLFEIWAGEIGFAVGAEFRRETQLDDRDPNVDGTNLWFDSVLGITQDSNLFGVSPTPDNRGERDVFSAYIEAAVPLVSEAMEVPLVQSLDLQLAGRFEDYSDFGSVAKPKVAFNWEVVNGLKFRGAYSEGFRAPNLEQVNASIVTRGNNRDDWIRCEAELRSGRIASFADCDQRVVATAQRAGNPDLQPEESVNKTIGAVFEPRFLPDSLGSMTFTVDYWNIDQEGIVGVFGGGNALALDYLLRLQGSSNPDVIRDDPNATDIAQFEGTGIDPVGEVRFVNDQYRNLAPQTSEGIDIGYLWSISDTPVGDFNLTFNAARLLTLSRGVLDGVDDLLAAREAGIINAGTDLPSAEDQIEDNGNPKWRYSTSLTWSKGNARIGAHARYVGPVNDTSLRDANGDPFRVDSDFTVNLFGEYNFESQSFGGTTVRLGVRNLFDQDPPRADETFGYLGALHSPIPRYGYVRVSKEF